MLVIFAMMWCARNRQSKYDNWMYSNEGKYY